MGITNGICKPKSLNIDKHNYIILGTNNLIKIESIELYKILSTLPQDAEGFVTMKEFLDKAAEIFHCTPLTIRNFLKKNSEFFEYRHGLIRGKKIDTLEDQAEDQKEYSEWLKPREGILDECLHFLKYQTPSPYIENLLVRMATAREELKSYTELQLLNVLLDLKREYNFIPKTTLTGSETRNEPQNLS